MMQLKIKNNLVLKEAEVALSKISLKWCEKALTGRLFPLKKWSRCEYLTLIKYRQRIAFSELKTETIIVWLIFESNTNWWKTYSTQRFPVKRFNWELNWILKRFMTCNFKINKKFYSRRVDYIKCKRLIKVWCK